MTKFVLAVSGGVDSVALLDMVAHRQLEIWDQLKTKSHDRVLEFPSDFIVAHFDHGIRGEQSHQDAMFVQHLCRDYGVECQLGHGGLTAAASEELARRARYNFLHSIKQREEVSGGRAYIVTAHHQDDLIETVVINLVRGTGWRGVAPFTDDSVVVRPLLDHSKTELVDYAIGHNLSWVEDQTNFSYSYFRNRVRDKLAGVSPERRRALLGLINQQRQLRPIIESEIAEYVRTHTYSNDNATVAKRYDLIMLPSTVAVEVLRYLTSERLTRPQLAQLRTFIGAAKPHKIIRWRDVMINVDKRYAYFHLG